MADTNLRGGKKSDIGILFNIFSTKIYTYALSLLGFNRK